MTGFNSKQRMAADKLQETVSFPCCGYTDAIKWNQFNGVVQCHMCGQVYTASPAAQPPLPAQETDMLTIAYQSGFYDGKKAALAGREWNYCERCGKRTADLTVIHTCTPPQGNT
jgi:hypothetical protein